MIKYLIILVFSILVFYSCVEKYEPVIGKNGGGSLVVEGKLSNVPRESYVSLSKSISLNEERLQPLSNAIVEVIDQNDNCTEMQETIFGTYKFLGEELAPVADEYYRLHIITPDGKEYLSEPEIYHQAVSINALEKDFLTKTIKWEGNSVGAAHISLSENPRSYNVEEDSLYFYHDFIETYAFISPYQGSDVCEVEGTRELIREKFLPCYITDDKDLPQNVTKTSREQLGDYNVITFQAGFSFLIGNSLIVRRHRVSQAYYEYMEKLQQLGEYGGSIFDTPPFNLSGNIYEVDNESEYALGYFHTESVSYADRVFIDNKEIPGRIYENRNTKECYNNLDNPEFLNEEDLIRPQPHCCDCRLKQGSSEEKPDFWPVN